MPGRSSAIMFVCMVAIALAANKAEDTDYASSMSAGRSVASEIKQSYKVSAPILIHTEKIRGPVSTSIQLISTGPSKAGDTFTLKGLFSSRKDVADLGYQWSLPKDVEIVNGELSGVISTLRPGQDFSVEITLRALSNSNAQIHLSVNGGSHPGLRFGDAAQFNTLDQEKLDIERKELKKTTRALVNQQRKAGQVPRKQRFSTDDTDLNVFQ